MKVLLVGSTRPGHMGSYLASAAAQLGLDCRILDTNDAEASTRIGRMLHWRLRKRRPARLRQFGSQVVAICTATQVDLVITTGFAPLDQPHLEALRGEGIHVVNYSTDDPWNPALSAPWFISVLPSYDAVFTTRRANLDDFRRLGVRSVHHLPFAHDPEIHRPWPGSEPTGAPSDVLFVGGCDRDRLPLIGALIDAGLEVALFGGYWDRDPKTRPYWRGNAGQDVIRAASAAARICLCLVRRANRDGHVMRSFEAAAIGGCLLVEETPDHREMFGIHDEAVRYFNTSADLVQEAKALIADAQTRRRLTNHLHDRFPRGQHTYRDRLLTMISSIGNAKRELVRSAR